MASRRVSSESQLVEELLNPREVEKAEILKLKQKQDEREQGGQWIKSNISNTLVFVAHGKDIDTVIKRHEEKFKQNRIIFVPNRYKKKNKEEQEVERIEKIGQEFLEVADE